MSRFSKADALVLLDNYLFQDIIKAMEKEFCEDFISSSFSSDAIRLTASIRIGTLRDLRSRIEALATDTVEPPQKTQRA